MENFITWLVDSFAGVIVTLVEKSVYLIDNAIEAVTGLQSYDYAINLVLFSDTPIIANNLYSLLGVFFSVFYGIIFIVVSWKIIKKVFRKITGWTKW